MSSHEPSLLEERPLPHSAEAERAILGSVLLDNALFNHAIELMCPEDFYVRAHQLVFRAMTALSERGSEIDPLLLSEELRRQGVLEQAGGMTFISELTYGLPHFTNIAAYAKVVKDHSLMRQLVKVADKITSEALEGEDEATIILDHAQNLFAGLKDAHPNAGGARASVMTSFADFMRADFDDGEEIAFHARRGELVLVQSVTNHGKSTLIRNAALSLVTGGALPPVVGGGGPRRVLLLNFEGSAGWFRNDITVMTQDFTAAEISLVTKNFFPTHAPEINGEPLTLSWHMRAVESQVRREGGVDVLIIDTASAAFSLKNENDNAEVANSVLKPLVRLARRLNCLIILVHHVGKAKAEEGAAREQAHRGRGASAWGDFCSSIFNLDAAPNDRERVTVTCGKRKNGSNYDCVLKLDRERRWFKATDETPAKPMTNDDLVLEAMEGIGQREMQTAEIISALAGKVKRRTMMESLNRLSNAGKVVSPRHGWWQLTAVCANCASPYRGVHTCTNGSSGLKGLQVLELPVGGVLTGNGNGFHGGSHAGD